MKPKYYILDEINLLECENRLEEFIETEFHSIFGHPEFCNLISIIRTNITIVDKQLPRFKDSYTRQITLN